MAASLRFPFTWAQWQELERQALIYKYMVASVPIPPDLLLPTTRNLSDNTFSHSSLNRGPCFNLRFSNGMDPEPGRCRRTDGKKWRCSRDVAPDQKYCERHMHRGRPRSRKPVELHSDINTNTRHVPHTTPATTTYTTYHHLRATEPYPHQFGLVPKFDMKPSPFGTMVVSSSRCVDWMMKGETVAIASPNQQLQQLMQSSDCSSNIYNTKALFFEQHYEDTRNLNSFTDQNCLFLNPLEEPINISSEEREHNTGTASCNKSSVSSSGKLPLANLSLSMSRGSSPSENLDSIQMPDESGAVKSPPPSLNWMTPASWVASPPGGPLGEVLQPRTAMVETADTSSQDCSSGSPTFNASVAAAKSEIALQWLNYSKLPSSSF